MTEIYFPEPAFENIMEFVGDSKKEKNKELWSRIRVNRRETRNNIYTHCWDWVDNDENGDTECGYAIYEVIDNKIDWSKTDLLKPIIMIANGWNGEVIINMNGQ